LTEERPNTPVADELEPVAAADMEGTQ